MPDRLAKPCQKYDGCCNLDCVVLDFVEDIFRAVSLLHVCSSSLQQANRFPCGSIM